MLLTLPKKALEIIDEYLNIHIGGHTLACPYYKNIHKQKAQLRVLAGKGTPQEIIEQAHEYAKKERVHVSQLTLPETRNFLSSHNLGIDCSGLVVHIFSALDTRFVQKLLYYKKGQNVFRFLISRLRPVENISVKTLTSNYNTLPVNELSEILPGDLVRTRHGDHVLLVRDVEKENNAVVKITYIHSTGYYGDTNGVRMGSVVITDLKKPLSVQQWTEVDKITGRNYTQEGYSEGGEDSGVYRLKHL